MKNAFKILFYLSLLFLAIFLAKADFLVLPTKFNWLYFSISILFLFFGMILQGENWFVSLNALGYKIQRKDALVSSGLSIFMKYVPGKVMVIVGRASFISNKYKIKLVKTSSASFLDQILTLITGTMLGCFLFFFIHLNIVWLLFSFMSLVFMISFIWYFNHSRKVIYRLGLLFKKRIFLPKISKWSIFKTLPYFFICWLFLSIGFWIMALAIDSNVSFSISFAFPLAAVLGIAAILAPGGLGAREGVLIVLLKASGLLLETATLISVFSRLWFLIGEIFFFLVAFVLNRIKN